MTSVGITTAGQPSALPAELQQLVERERRVLPDLSVQHVPEHEIVPRFGWNEQRLRLLRAAAGGLDYFHQTHGVSWIVGGGSLFTSDKVHPNDADMLTIGIDRRQAEHFDRVWGHGGSTPKSHPATLFPADALRNGTHGATMLRTFATTREGTPVAMPLMQIDDLVRAVRTAAGTLAR